MNNEESNGSKFVFFGHYHKMSRIEFVSEDLATVDFRCSSSYVCHRYKDDVLFNETIIF